MKIYSVQVFMNYEIWSVLSKCSQFSWEEQIHIQGPVPSNTSANTNYDGPGDRASGDSFIGVGASRKTQRRPWRRRDRSLMLLNPMWVVEAAEPESSRLKTKACLERGEWAATERKTQNA